MKFKDYIFEDAPPMGNPPAMGGGMPPMGGMGDPMGGGMGGMGDPMGGGMGGPMGGMGDPMGGPMGAGPASINQTPIIPKNADVWKVLDHILNNKPLDDKDEEPKKQSTPKNNSSLMS